MLGIGLQQSTSAKRTSVREFSKFAKGFVTRIANSWRYHTLISQQRFPSQVRQIVIVCKGNICRSPLAEIYLRSMLQKQGSRIIVKSAGLETSVGKPAHPLAKIVGQETGLSLETHTTQPLLKEHVDAADLIVVMEWAHRYRLLRLYPNIREKVFLLGQFSDSFSPEIADPYDGTPQDFQRCFKVITQSCDYLILQVCSVSGDR